MEFGGTAEERLQLNESTLWGGRPNDYANTNAGKLLPGLRRLIFEGKLAEAGRVAGDMLGQPHLQMPYQPFGDLRLRFPGHDKAEGYSRSLDLEQATAVVRYRIGDVEFTREAFASYPDQALVIRLTCSKPGQLSFEVGLDTPHAGVETTTIGNNTLRMAGQLPPRPGSENWSSGWNEPGMNFEGRVLVMPEGGLVEADKKQLKIRGINAATLVFVAATSFKNYRDVSADPQARVESCLAALRGRTFAQLRKKHLADYQKPFQRVRLDLGSSAQAAKPTDQRIREFNGANDPALVALYYQFGRYLLLSSSRPGGQPANLQGLWNQDLWPAWSSKWTCNINLEMNYWSAETGNLPECHQPLFDLVDDLRVTGKQTARTWYGCRGFVVHHNTDLWRGTAPVDGSWGLWPMGGVWLV